MSSPPGPVFSDPFSVEQDAAKIKQRSLAGSLIMVVSQGLKMLIQMASQIILARLLFPSDFGILAMIYPIVTFIQLFSDIGLGQAIIQRTTLDSARVSSLFWINLSLASAAGLVIIAAAPLAAWIYREPPIIGPMIALGLFVPVSAMGIHPGALLSRQMRFGWMAWNDVATSAIGLIVTAGCAWLGLRYWSLVIGQIVTAIFSTVRAWIACGWRPMRPAFVSSAWEDLRFGGNLTGANLATFLTTSGDNIIVGAALGVVPLGLYDRSYRLVVQPLGQIFLPVGRVAVPLLSRLKDFPSEYRSTYLKMIRTILLLGLPVMLVCITDGGVVIRFLLGPKWTPAASVFSWVCVGGLTSGLYSSLFWLFVSQARTREMMRFMSLAAIINIASFIAGVFGGITSVAMYAALTFVSVTTPLVTYGATRVGPVHYSDVIRGGLPHLITAIVIYSGLRLLEQSLNLPDLFQLIVLTLVSYGGTIVLISLSAEDRRLLISLIKTVTNSWRSRAKKS